MKGGAAGSYTKEDGIFSYYEICDKLNSEGWKKHWDDNQQSFYATRDDQWVGFDNQRSISLKVKWASTMSLGGTMLWTLDFDDYTGQFCNEGAFPIASAIKSVFDEFSVTTTTTSTTTTSTQSDEDDNSVETAATTTSESTVTTTSSKLGLFIGSGDIVFSGSINGISIGYDSNYGALPPSLLSNGSSNSNSSPNNTHIVVDSTFKNSAVDEFRLFSSSCLSSPLLQLFFSLLIFIL